MEDGTLLQPRHKKGTDALPRPDETATCELRDLLDRLGDKWSLLVVELLGHGVLRFSELKRQIDGISQRMLTLTLRHLERDGLITRTVHPVVPPRVDYELTALGRSLLDALGDYAVDLDRIVWKRSFALRGPTSLPLTAGSARSSTPAGSN